MPSDEPVQRFSATFEKVALRKSAGIHKTAVFRFLMATTLVLLKSHRCAP